jgi:hypothetical protein
MRGAAQRDQRVVLVGAADGEAERGGPAADIAIGGGVSAETLAELGRGEIFLEERARRIGDGIGIGLGASRITQRQRQDDALSDSAVTCAPAGAAIIGKICVAAALAAAGASAAAPASAIAAQDARKLVM